MVYRYVPILRWKKGERDALRNMAAGSRNDVIPLFVVGADRYVGREATKKHPALPPATVLVQEIARIWGNNPFYLDASAVSATSSIAHPLAAIATQARALGLSLIPATTLAAPILYQVAVDTITKIDHRGVALRVDLQQFASIGSWSTGWSIPQIETDLIADFAGNMSAVSDLGITIDPVFIGAATSGKWRTITMAGTSMPENFTGYAAGTHILKRAEWTMWQRLSSTAGLPYRLDYGDYATISVVPAPEGISWGYPINVKYTLDSAFLICRGVTTTGLGGVDMGPQLIAHARTIMSYPGRRPLAHCVGDQQIDHIALTGQKQGNLPTWVTISVNRHIELVRHLLP